MAHWVVEETDKNDENGAPLLSLAKNGVLVLESCAPHICTLLSRVWEDGQDVLNVSYINSFGMPYTTPDIVERGRGKWESVWQMLFMYYNSAISNTNTG